MVTHVLVTSRLYYCNALYIGLPLKTIRKMQLVQDEAACMLVSSTQSGHCFDDYTDC